MINARSLSSKNFTDIPAKFPISPEIVAVRVTDFGRVKDEFDGTRMTIVSVHAIDSNGTKFSFDETMLKNFGFANIFSRDPSSRSFSSIVHDVREFFVANEIRDSFESR